MPGYGIAMVSKAASGTIVKNEKKTDLEKSDTMSKIISELEFVYTSSQIVQLGRHMLLHSPIYRVFSFNTAK